MSSKRASPFIGETVTFAKKYPQIKEVQIAYEQMESRLPRDGRKGILTESGIQHTMPCGWKNCLGGGFPIEEQIISRMVSNRLTELEGTVRCDGHEMLGGKIGYHCTNYLEFKAKITYHDSVEQE